MFSKIYISKIELNRYNRGITPPISGFYKTTTTSGSTKLIFGSNTIVDHDKLCHSTPN